jgi:hypothetical protein
VFVAADHANDITTALIALAGAIVGGLLTGGAQLFAERMRDRREHDVAQARVLGVQRVVDYSLSLWEALLDQAHEQGKWWHADLEPERGWTDGDLQMVASLSDQESWNQIRVALVVTQAASIMRRTAGDDPDLEFGKTVTEAGASIHGYARMRSALQAGRQALERSK